MAKKLAQPGVHVSWFVGRNVERGEKTVDEIRAAGGQTPQVAVKAYQRMMRSRRRGCETCGRTHVLRHSRKPSLNRRMAILALSVCSTAMWGASQMCCVAFLVPDRTGSFHASHVGARNF